MSAAAILERETQLLALQTVLREVGAGPGRVALISGEAGIGKTTLIEQFCAGQTSAWRVLWGACNSYSTPRPFGPWYDIAAQIQGQAVFTPEAQADPQAIFSTCLQLLQSKPSILVIEDVHWADDATLDLIKFLARRIRTAQALIILTYRDDEIGLRHPLRPVLGELARVSHPIQIQLPRLSAEAVQTLAAGKSVNARHLYRLTNGNPFFVTEVLAGGAGIPATVRDAVLARAAGLSPSGLAVLEAAAVIGPRVEPWLLTEVTAAEAAASDECIGRGLLQNQGDLLGFRHELAWQTIFTAVSAHKKLVLHRLVLATLRASPAQQQNLARLAYHAEGANDGEAVLEYAPASARQAASVNAHREAAAQYERALRFAESLPPPRLAVLLEAYARECNMIDQREKGIAARLKALEIWRMAGNLLNQGENLTQLMVMYFGVGQTAEAERVSREAIDILEGLPPSAELARAYRIQAAIRMFVRDNQEAIAWAEKAVALAEQFGDLETLSGAYNAMGSAWMIIDYGVGQTYLEKSLAIAREAGLQLQVSNAYNNMSSASGEVYRYDQADRYLVEGLAHTLEYGFDVTFLYMQAWQALTHLHLGRWKEAAECAPQVLAVPGVSAISRIMALLALGRLRARRGDPGGWEALDEALVLAERTETLQRIAPVRAARAEAAWLTGDRERARFEAQAACDLALSKHHPWLLGELLFWRHQAGEQVAVPAWAALPFAAQIAGDWRTAAAAWEQLRCPYEQAGALAEGDQPAQMHALQIYEQLGARPALERLKQHMREKGVAGVPRGPRPATREHPWGLTAREMDVLALLVKGMANQEIAVRLSISPRTAEHHLAAIFAKMEVQSRSEAIAAALRLPVFEG